MPRKGTAQKRDTRDPRYGNAAVGKFINCMMQRGKKSVAATILYGALDGIQKRSEEEPLEVFLKAMANVKPTFEVKSRRVGGSTYQVPIEVRETRQEALAIRWIIQYAKGRRGKSMSDSLGAELLDAFNGTGAAVKKKEDTHRMAEANKAFSHYRW